MYWKAFMEGMRDEFKRRISIEGLCVFLALIDCLLIRALLNN